ncbi:MAG: histidine kinase dimerization/phosphoacceptor domain-containing protein [Vicinamibacterales bacterium]
MAQQWMVAQGLLTIARWPHPLARRPVRRHGRHDGVASSVAAINHACGVPGVAGLWVAVQAPRRRRARRETRELAQASSSSASHRELLARSSRIAERLRIARELHDSLDHHLTVLGVNLELASHLAKAGPKRRSKRAQVVTRRS